MDVLKDVATHDVTPDVVKAAVNLPKLGKL
jgi:hypothetical protein